MSLISRLLHAVQSWRRRRGGRKAAPRAGVSMEHLDHRQLLSVNFTGNVATDFPVTSQPGVVYLQDNPSVVHPVISPDIAPIVKVSGFDVNGIRVTYTAADDTLSIGIQQPLSQQPTHPGPVIAGDSDNNGNDGTVDPAVTAIKGPSFQDFPDFGGSEYMGVFLDLKGSGFADVVAGYAINDPRSPKQYQVAQAVVNTSLPPSTLPSFGAELPQYEGNVYKVNSPQHPNLEFSITHFSQLYLAETGKPLTANTTLKMGAFAGSQDDLGIGEAFFPEQAVNIGQATPPPPPTCPPASPPIYINPHANYHVNTAHDDPVRVNVLGSSGFDVTKIIPGSVTLGGAHPVWNFDRFINHDPWIDATFVFRGSDVHLPRGYTNATVTGTLTDGTTFSSTVPVFNRDRSFYSPSANLTQMQRQAARDTRLLGFQALPPGSPIAATPVSPTPTQPVDVTVPVAMSVKAPKPLKVDMGTAARPLHGPKPIQPKPGPVVSIKRREPVVRGGVAAAQKPALSSRLQASLNRYVRDVGAVNVGSAATVPTGGR